jgi:carbon monoxide dehydrogenase subunit G
MKISGTSTLDAPVDKVWEAMLDPAVLARCLPGCESLSVIEEDRYAMAVTAGVAAIKGTYAGEVALSEKVEPHSLTMKASGVGAPGTIDADVRVRLTPSAGGGTDLTFDADASVGGAIGGVGQRMLAGVTKKMAGQFFTALDQDIAGLLPVRAPAAGRVAVPGAVAAPGVPGPAAAPGVAGPEAAPGVAGAGVPGQVYAGRPAAHRGGFDLGSGSGFALGAVVGGLLALAGVALGARIGRRR